MLGEIKSIVLLSELPSTF